MLVDETISAVYACVNGRFNEMIEGPDRGMYIASLFLDFSELLHDSIVNATH